MVEKARRNQVDGEFLCGAYSPEDFNSIASDVAGLGGRPDLMFSGILGPCVLTGKCDDEGNTTGVNEAGRRAVERIAREAR